MEHNSQDNDSQTADDGTVFDLLELIEDRYEMERVVQQSTYDGHVKEQPFDDSPKKEIWFPQDSTTNNDTVKGNTSQQNEDLLSGEKKAEQGHRHNFWHMDEKFQKGCYANLSGGDGRVLFATKAQEMDQNAYQHYTTSLNQNCTVSDQPVNPTASSSRNPLLLEAWGEARGAEGANSNQQRQQQATNPGAYALAPTGPTDRSQTFGTVNYEMNHETATNPVEGGNAAGLAVATEVHEDTVQPGSLQQAEEYTRGRNSNSEKHAYATKVALGIIWLLCLVIGAVLLVFFKGQGGEMPAMEPADDPMEEEHHTLAPSVSPLIEQVLGYFPNHTIQALEDPESPQYQALDWLLDDPNLLDYIDLEWRVRQRFALVTMYYSTRGLNWTDSQNWLSYSHHECFWFDSGEIFFPLPGTGDKYFRGDHLNPCHLPNYSALGNGTNDDMTLLDSDPTQASYKQLWLHMNNLEGQLPEEIYLLTSLETMSLFFNNIDGPISSEIGHLEELQAAIFSFTGVTGTIPTEIGMLSNSLAFFISEENNHFGILPSELGVLSRMETLMLDVNQLSGTLPPELFRLSDLEWLYLDGNPISGTIPSVELGLLSNLEWISLFRTALTGTVPTEIGMLQNLEWLYLHGNLLTGTLPSEFGLLPLLMDLSLEANVMHGPIPSEIGMLSSLRTLSIYYNHFNASIPTELGVLPLVHTIEINDNTLSGPIPSEIAGLPNLYHFLAQNNQLTGAIPQEFLDMLGSNDVITLKSFNVTNNLLLLGDEETLCWLNATFFESPECYEFVWLEEPDHAPSFCFCDCHC